MNAMRAGVFAIAVSAFVILAGGALRADPCLVVYSSGPCTYHYDPTEYSTVGPGDPLYDPLYDRGGKVLLEAGSHEIDLSIYQAPHLTGFVATYDGNEGYFIDGTDFTLIIDGFSNSPTTYPNILVMFDKFMPTGCTPQIYADGTPVTGGTYGAGDLVVSTPYGSHYSDTKTVHISWRGCIGLRIWAFADADHDGKRDGGECFTAFSHDLTIPVQDKTWGSIKALYR